MDTHHTAAYTTFAMLRAHKERVNHDFRAFCVDDEGARDGMGIGARPPDPYWLLRVANAASQSFEGAGEAKF